jgi:hypothetical protein
LVCPDTLGIPISPCDGQGNVWRRAMDRHVALESKSGRAGAEDSIRLIPVD